MRITEYRIRLGSGGKGHFDGGDGLIRELECLTDSSVSLLAERREISPWGLDGGGDGATGADYLVSSDGIRSPFAAKANARLKAGDRIRIETPGGGAWGKR